MLVCQNDVILIFVAFVVLSTSAEQKKPEDCIQGKQYWSTTFSSSGGMCASCPRHWKNCDDQPIEDIQRCEESCRGKPHIYVYDHP